MAITVYKKTALTGGAATALDGIDGAGLLDGDFAFVTLSGILYTYILDDDENGVESSPDRITPDANPGTKRWILQEAYLKGVTSSVAELNILDGVTATAAELNLIDGSTAGTAVASKALVLGADKNIDTISIAEGGLKIGAGAGTAMTASAAELNKLDGVTATTAELNKLAGCTATTAELNVLAGIPATLTATELGYCDGVTSAIQTQIDGKSGSMTEISAALLLNLSNTSDVTWTDIDVTASRTGSAAAKFVVLRVEIDPRSTADGSSLIIDFRKNGTTNTFASAAGYVVSGFTAKWFYHQVIVPVDTNEVFEYNITQTNSGSPDNKVKVYMVGFTT